MATIKGTIANESLIASTGTDKLIGLGGHDTLDGGAGNDALYGGKGNDSYLFTINSGHDIIYEQQGNDDIIFTGLNQSDINFAKSNNGNDLSATIKTTHETLTLVRAFNNDYIGYEIESFQFNDGTLSLAQINTLTNSSDTANNLLIGWGYADTLIGNDGNDTLIGNDGDDIIDGGSDNDFLQGNNGQDTLKGGYGQDTLDGGAGNDRLEDYRGGDDTYLIDKNAGNDTISEYGGGNDTVILAGFNQSEVTFTKARDGLDLVIRIKATHQVLTLASIFFNDASYAIESFKFDDVRLSIAQINTISNTGDATDNLLIGWQYSNILMGYAGNDTLRGDMANDVLDGGLGEDIMQGGWGNDSYYVDSINDKVVELKREGKDNIYSSVTYSLSDNVENLVLTNAAAINATGNNLANKITGNSSNNSLDGGAGSDTLIGGLGQDTFILSDLFKDTIKDFSVADDTIQLKASVFSTLAGGAVSVDNFVIGSATNTNQHLLYDNNTGVLAYDSDGSGNANAVTIAVLGSHLALSNTDFIVA